MYSSRRLHSGTFLTFAVLMASVPSVSWATACDRIEIDAPALGEGRDASPVIQEALDAAADCGGGRVVLPVGRFPIDKSLLIDSRVTVQGHGAKETTLESRGCFPILQNRNRSEGNIGIRVEEIGFEGLPGRVPGWRCPQQLIRLVQTRDFAIRDVELRQSAENGLVIGRGSRRGLIHHVVAYRNDDIGIYIQNAGSDADDDAIEIVDSAALENGSSGFAAFSSQGIIYRNTSAVANGRLRFEASGFNLDGSRFVFYDRCFSAENGQGFASYSKPKSHHDRFVAEAVFFRSAVAAANRDRGFLFHGARQVTMQDSIARDNGRFGIDVLAASGTELPEPILVMTAGQISGNGQRALRRPYRSAVLMTDVRFEGDDSAALPFDVFARWGFGRSVADALPARHAAGTRTPGKGGIGTCPEITPWTDRRAWGLALQDPYLYVATGSGFSVLDVTRPTSPSEVASMELGQGGVGIGINGDTLFLWTTSDQLFSVDVSNPQQPKLLGMVQIGLSTQTPGQVHAIEFSGSYAYLAPHGLPIVDISNLAQPTVVGDLPGDGAHLRVRDNLVYVADSDFKIFDVSNPLEPKQLGLVPVGRSSRSVDVAGDFAFLALRGRMVRVFRITNPSAPFALGTYETSETVNHLASQRGFLQCSQRQGFLTGFDVSNPLELEAIYELGIAGVPGDLAIRKEGNVVYVASGIDGLVIVKPCPLFSDGFELGIESWDLHQP